MWLSFFWILLMCFSHFRDFQCLFSFGEYRILNKISTSPLSKLPPKGPKMTRMQFVHDTVFVKAQLVTIDFIASGTGTGAHFPQGWRVLDKYSCFPCALCSNLPLHYVISIHSWSLDTMGHWWGQWGVAMGRVWTICRVQINLLLWHRRCSGHTPACFSMSVVVGRNTYICSTTASLCSSLVRGEEDGFNSGSPQPYNLHAFLFLK